MSIYNNEKQDNKEIINDGIALHSHFAHNTQM